MLDNVIKMNLMLLAGVLLVAFLALISITVAACIELSQKHMSAHIPIFVVAGAAVELFIVGICFAEYLIGR